MSLLPQVRAHPRLALVAALVAVGIAWWCWWQRAAVQVPATMARLVDAVQNGSASGVMAELHADYPAPQLWAGELAAVADLPLIGKTSNNASATAAARDLMQRGLGLLFLKHNSDRFRMEATVHDELIYEADGSITAKVTFRIAPSSGGSPRLGPVQGHRFRFVRSGFWPRLRIIDHDPLQRR